MATFSPRKAPFAIAGRSAIENMKQKERYERINLAASEPAIGTLLKLQLGSEAMTIYTDRTRISPAAVRYINRTILVGSRNSFARVALTLGRI